MLLEATIINTLDRFLEKSKPKRVNKPFKALQKTSEYKGFQEHFDKAIKDQGQWAVDNLDDLFKQAGITDDFEPLTEEQKSRLKIVIARGMPTTEKLISEYRVNTYLIYTFNFAVKEMYKRWGLMVKDVTGVNFSVTDPKYIKMLNDQAHYLLNQSSLDDTTISDLIDTISTGKLDGYSNDEVASEIGDKFPDLAGYRADMIARTESANAMGDANMATITENGVQTKSWVCAGANCCDECQSNEDDGEIPIDQSFSSGDDNEPAHPNCECYIDAGEIDLSSISIWDGGGDQ